MRKTTFNLNMKTWMTGVIAFVSFLFVTPAMAGDEAWFLVAQSSIGTVQLPMTTVSSMVSLDDNQGVAVLDRNGNILAEEVTVAEFKLMDTSSVIPQTIHGKANLLSGLVQNQICITGATSDITIYGADGTAVLHQPSESGTTTISVQHLPHGTYIVKTGQQTFKFVKK